MVQIIQSQPTQRQSALEQALGQAIQGFGQAYLQGQQTLRQRALTEEKLKREQELQNEKMKADAIQSLVRSGYEVTPQNMALIQGKTPEAQIIEPAQPAIEAQPAQFETTQLQGPVKPGMAPLGTYERQVKEAVAAQPARPAVLGQVPTSLTYTEAKKAENERKRQLQDIDVQSKLAGIQKAMADIEASKELAPLRKQQISAGLEKTAAEIGKLKTEGTGAQPQQKLAKMSAEAQSKVGALASGIKALGDMGKAIDQGFGPEYINPNTPLIGGLISDTPFTQAQRVVSEVIGRLQSGGAINDQEMRNFNNMGPRPGDSKEVAARKLKDQKSFLDNKLRAFGLSREDLGQIGFDIGGETRISAPPPGTDPGFEAWKKAKGHS